MGRQHEETHKELRMLFDNQCPHIVDFHGSFFDEKQHQVLIALERMTGSLDGLVSSGGALDEESLKSVMWQTLQALRYVHEKKKILHRDLKPQNILFNSEG